MSPKGLIDAERSDRATSLDIERVLESWTSRVPAGASAHRRSDSLIEAYRVLGRVVLDQALRGMGELNGEQARSRARAIARVAAAIRREELTIADAIGDLQGLVPATLEEAGGEHDASALRTALAVSRGLDPATRRIVRAVEAAALRSRRERREALVALTDQLSHELQNRLGAARTASQMLLPGDADLGDIDLTRVGELVQTSVEAALRTVDDVRDLVASRTELEMRDVRRMSLPRLIRSVMDDLSPPAFEVGVELKAEGDIADCEVDGARFRLIVFNLIGNGIKYRDPDKRDSWVHVGTERSREGEVRLSVSDNGLGIPPDDIEDIFMPWSRGGEISDVPGSGLGLAIVREAVEQIGGRIDVDSEVGEGTTFTVTFQPSDPNGDG